MGTMAINTMQTYAQNGSVTVCVKDTQMVSSFVATEIMSEKMGTERLVWTIIG